MMKRSIILFLVLLLSASAWCQEVNRTDAKGRRQGVWTDFYPNGQKRYEGQFKNDKCKGTFRYFDQEGHLQATNEFDKTGTKCLNKTYAPNGRMVATGYYVNQKKEGEWKYFDKNTGQLLLTEDNKQGVVDGWSNLYNPSTGKLAEETQYVGGTPEGQCRKYSDTGVLLMDCRYHAGQLEGPCRTYYPNTALKEEGNYVGGRKSGEWKTYNEDGDLLTTEVFE